LSRRLELRPKSRRDRGMARGRPREHGEQSREPSEGRSGEIRKPAQGPAEQGRETRPGERRSKKRGVFSAASPKHKVPQADLEREGKKVNIKGVCRILGFSRRSFYFKPRKRLIPLNPDKVQKVSDCIERFPTFGYRRIALALKENRKGTQRILQKKHWQVRKRLVGHCPRVKVVPS